MHDLGHFNTDFLSNLTTLFIYSHRIYLNPIPSRQKRRQGVSNQSGTCANRCPGWVLTHVPCENLTTQSINNTSALRQWLHLHRIKYSAVCTWLHWRHKAVQVTCKLCGREGHQSEESKLKNKSMNVKLKSCQQYWVSVATNKLYVSWFNNFSL